MRTDKNSPRNWKQFVWIYLVGVAALAIAYLLYKQTIVVGIGEVLWRAFVISLLIIGEDPHRIIFTAAVWIVLSVGAATKSGWAGVKNRWLKLAEGEFIIT